MGPRPGEQGPDTAEATPRRAHRQGAKTPHQRDPPGRELERKQQKQGLFYRVRALGVLGPRHTTSWAWGLEVDTKEVSPLLCPLRTFNYILRELPKVPTHVPVCVLGNYRDMGEHRVILPDDVRDFIDNLDRWVGQPAPGDAPRPPQLQRCLSQEPGARLRQEDLGLRMAEPRVGSCLLGTQQACGGRGLVPPSLSEAGGRADAARPPPRGTSPGRASPAWPSGVGPGNVGALAPARGVGAGIRDSLAQVRPLAQRGCALLPTTSHLSLQSHFVLFANRPPGSSYFRYAESSMKNSFGLKYLHKFFNIPFLQLQVSPACRVRQAALGSPGAALVRGQDHRQDLMCWWWRPQHGPLHPLPSAGLA